jgi:integrase
VAVLQAILNYAIDDEQLGKNPAVGVNLPKSAPVDRRPLTPEEVVRLIDAIDPFYRPFIYIAVTTGLRWSELVGLQMQDAILEGPEPQLTVNRGLHSTTIGLSYEKPKSTAGHRTLPLVRTQVTMMQEHLESTSEYRNGELSDPIFMTKSGRYLDYKNFTSRYFKPAVNKAGLEGVRIHDLRRTTATLLAATNHGLKTITTMMGHSDFRLTLGIYASTTYAQVQNAMNDLASLIEPRS